MFKSLVYFLLLYDGKFAKNAALCMFVTVSFRHCIRLLGPAEQRAQTEALLSHEFLPRPEVQDGGVSSVMLLLKTPGKELVRASLLASGSSLACGSIAPIFTRRTLCACV